jgi:hypothetical protein
MKTAALPLLLAGLLGAGLAHAGQADHVRASAAWLRVLPGDLPAGAYVTLANDGDQPARLVGAASPAYGEAMLHRSSTEGGTSRMEMVDGMDIPAHGKATLAPGGYHLMLMKATKPVQPGQAVKVTLKFADGSALDADFAAKPANATGN